MGEKIIRINMTNLTTAIEAVPADLAGLGGRALTSTVVAKEVPPPVRPWANTTSWYLHPAY